MANSTTPQNKPINKKEDVKPGESKEKEKKEKGNDLFKVFGLFMACSYGTIFSDCYCVFVITMIGSHVIQCKWSGAKTTFAMVYIKSGEELFSLHKIVVIILL